MAGKTTIAHNEIRNLPYTGVGPGIPPVRCNDTRVERIKLQDNTVVEAVDGKALEEALRRAGIEPAYRRKLLGADR